MSEWLKWIMAAAGLIYVAFAMSLLVRKKINERNTLVWIGTCVVILVLSINPETLDWLARQFGVAYPPSLLFLLSVLVLLLFTLYQSTQISALQEKVKELSQHVALQDVEERKYGANADNRNDNIR
ncbi:MAG TPA: DUF2304 domain-containing protein [Paenibacillus sp.]|nr:DUF2304 domain-containing protein [Paenibacillus sp.]